MRSLKKYVFILFLLPLLAFTTHKYYISLTQIDYAAEQNSLQITMRVFIDDLETTLNKIHQKEFELATKKELKDVDIYFEEYLRTHVNFKIDTIEKNYDYIGKEYENDMVVFYIEITNITSVNSIEVQNTILMDDFQTQENIIKSKVNQKHKSLILTKKNDKGLLKF